MGFDSVKYSQAFVFKFGMYLCESGESVVYVTAKFDEMEFSCNQEMFKMICLAVWQGQRILLMYLHENVAIVTIKFYLNLL